MTPLPFCICYTNISVKTGLPEKYQWSLFSFGTNGGGTGQFFCGEGVERYGGTVEFSSGRLGAVDEDLPTLLPKGKAKSLSIL